jgi:hypothetical protein
LPITNGNVFSQPQFDEPPQGDGLPNQLIGTKPEGGQSFLKIILERKAMVFHRCSF